MSLFVTTFLSYLNILFCVQKSHVSHVKYEHACFCWIGLRRARVGEETIVSVTVLDDAGHLLGDGGDDIQADIYSVDDIKK